MPYYIQVQVSVGERQGGLCLPAENLGNTLVFSNTTIIYRGEAGLESAACSFLRECEESPIFFSLLTLTIIYHVNVSQKYLNISVIIILSCQEFGALIISVYHIYFTWRGRHRLMKRPIMVYGQVKTDVECAFHRRYTGRRAAKEAGRRLLKNFARPNRF